jgi:hypothetical protein
MLPSVWRAVKSACAASTAVRLVRGTGRILDVLDVLHAGRLALRIHDGAFSAMTSPPATRAPANCWPR